MSAADGSDLHRQIAASLDDAAEMVSHLRKQAATLAGMAAELVQAFRKGGRLLTCGNGGSAAEALHLSEELVGRFHERRPALPALCLCADSTALTCIANDWEYGEVFARQIEAHGKPGDLLIALSTSGRSKSILRGLETARKMGLRTAGLLGPADSPAHELCDSALTLDGVSPARIQEAHLIAIHLFLEQVDAAFASP